MTHDQCVGATFVSVWEITGTLSSPPRKSSSADIKSQLMLRTDLDTTSQYGSLWIIEAFSC